MSLRQVVKSRPRSQLLALGVVLILAVGVLDYLTGPEITFSIFYVLPVFGASWYAGKESGILLAILSGGVWLLVEEMGGLRYSHVLAQYWNLAVRITFFLLIGVGVPLLKLQLQESVTTVRKLRELLPMCAWCRRIRDERGGWYTLEAFIESHTEAEVTHGICPVCIGKYHTRTPDDGSDRPAVKSGDSSSLRSPLPIPE